MDHSCRKVDQVSHVLSICKPWGTLDRYTQHSELSQLSSCYSLHLGFWANELPVSVDHSKLLLDKVEGSRPNQPPLRYFSFWSFTTLCQWSVLQELHSLSVRRLSKAIQVASKYSYSWLTLLGWQMYCFWAGLVEFEGCSLWKLRHSHWTIQHLLEKFGNQRWHDAWSNLS